jgi:hypothetical protein
VMKIVFAMCIVPNPDTPEHKKLHAETRRTRRTRRKPEEISPGFNQK